MRSQLVNSAQNLRKRRNMTTNRKRRGGKKGKAEKRREHGLIGTLIHHKMKETGDTQFSDEELSFWLTDKPFADGIDVHNYMHPNRLQMTDDEKERIEGLLGTEDFLKVKGEIVDLP